MQRELEAAADRGKKIIPIKVLVGDQVLLPHICNLYEHQLGDPVFLDIRRRSPRPDWPIWRAGCSSGYDILSPRDKKRRRVRKTLPAIANAMRRAAGVILAHQRRIRKSWVRYFSIKFR